MQQGEVGDAAAEVGGEKGAEAGAECEAPDGPGGL